MAHNIGRAVHVIGIQARQSVKPTVTQQTAFLPCITQVAHLTSTHGEPAKRIYKPWPYENRGYKYFHQFLDHTRKRFDDNSKVIVIDGNIAVGKSWFGEKIAKEFDMKFFPDTKDEKTFLVEETGFDMRKLNERIPPRSGFCDLETFYSQRGPPELIHTFGRTLLHMYFEQFMTYARALEHLFNTGKYFTKFFL